VIKDPSSDHYHLGTCCAKSHSRPIYGTRYALDGKEPFSASAYKKLVSKLGSGELTAEMLMHEQQLTADELRAFVPIAPPAADAADPDDDGTYGIGGRCRLGLAHLQQVAGEKNSLLSKQQSPPLVIEELLGASLYTSPMYLKYALSTHPLSLSLASVLTSAALLRQVQCGTALRLGQRLSAGAVRKVQARRVEGRREDEL
jgi:hypothetical protein